MSINDDTHKAVSRCIMNGNKPEVIYVGEVQYSEIQKEARRFRGIFRKNQDQSPWAMREPDPEPERYAGLEIIRVNRRDWLAVGQKPEERDE